MKFFYFSHGLVKISLINFSLFLSLGLFAQINYGFLTLKPVSSCSVPTTVVDVLSPATGRTWMDRNLGALRAATSSVDALAYGDLYQWGRLSDEHQCRMSVTTSVNSAIDTPGHSSFILETVSPFDWRDPQNDNLWQGVGGVNNPCPAGYRLPTNTELNDERLSWSTNDAAGAFGSPLKLSLGGYRDASNGMLFVIGEGNYWTSTVDVFNARRLHFSNAINSANMAGASRGHGYSVRCLKE